jgi:hypothetical protein
MKWRGYKPWWMFWHPGSGGSGGLIAGILIFLLIILPLLIGTS